MPWNDSPLRKKKFYSGNQANLRSRKRDLSLTGFSLIELVLIIGVAVILSIAATLNQIRYYDTIKLDATAQRIASDLKYAQQLVMDRAPVTTQFLDGCFDNNSIFIQFFPDAYHDPYTNIDYPADSYKIQQGNYLLTSPIIDPATKQPFLIILGNLSEYSGVNIVTTTLNISLGIGIPFQNAVMFNSGLGYPGTAFILSGDNFCCFPADFDGVNPRYIQLSHNGKYRYIVIQPETGEINVQSTQP